MAARIVVSSSATSPSSHDHHDHDHGEDCDCGQDHSLGPRRIYIYSPSGAVQDKAAFRRGVKRLEALGHTVEIDPEALSRHTRFAGDDGARLAAIERAARSGADVALIARGGYGLTRLLPQLPYDAIAESVRSGMHWVGHSDFTALQCAVLAQKGTVTWAGPALGADFGATDGPDEIMQACFEDLLYGFGEGTGWRMPKERLPEGTPPALPETLEIDDAPLWGGNLAVLASLVGTPYLPAMEGGILYLEDVNEHPYRIERLLTQLLYAGILGRQRAIVLGQFNGFSLNAQDKGFKLASVVQWLRSQVQIPVLTGLPFGHVPTKVLLPMGAPVSLTVEGRDAMIYWGHLDAGGAAHHHHHAHDHDHADHAHCCGAHEDCQHG